GDSRVTRGGRRVRLARHRRRLVPANRFGPTSRYASIGTATFVRPDGSEVPYVKRRIIAPPEAFETIQEHRVLEGERPDTIAADEIGRASCRERVWSAGGDGGG